MSPIDLAQSVALAATLKDLHDPGNPIVFANIYDLASLNALLSLNSESHKPVKAVATASYAIAEQFGIRDEYLSLEQNLAAIVPIGKSCHEAGVPLSVDLQDGYGDSFEKCVVKAVERGAVGCNIEDVRGWDGTADWKDGELYPMEEAKERVRRVLEKAEELGVGDFVVNARCDVMRLDPLPGDALQQTIERGKAYLDAGATTVFVWGLRRGLRDEEVRKLVEAFGGRLAVKLSDKAGALTVKELSEMGVARISVGPSLWRAAMTAVKESAKRILEGGGLFVA